MSKTEQVRLPTDLMRDARICAAGLHDKSLPEYVTRILREAVARDYPLALKELSQRLPQTSQSESKGQGRKKS